MTETGTGIYWANCTLQKQKINYLSKAGENTISFTHENIIPVQHIKSTQTNNGTESCHAHLNEQFNSAHPTSFLCLSGFEKGTDSCLCDITVTSYS